MFYLKLNQGIQYNNQAYKTCDISCIIQTKCVKLLKMLHQHFNSNSMFFIYHKIRCMFENDTSFLG